MITNGKTPIIPISLINFTKKDFKCPCCDLTSTRTFMNTIQTVRTICGFPFVVNSSKRCKTHNKKVGGKPKSYHLKGEAIDISTKGLTPGELGKMITTSLFMGFRVLIYPTFIHLDTHPMGGVLYMKGN